MSALVLALVEKTVIYLVLYRNAVSSRGRVEHALALPAFIGRIWVESQAVLSAHFFADLISPAQGKPKSILALGAVLLVSKLIAVIHQSKNALILVQKILCITLDALSLFIILLTVVQKVLRLDWDALISLRVHLVLANYTLVQFLVFNTSINSCWVLSALPRERVQKEPLVALKTLVQYQAILSAFVHFTSSDKTRAILEKESLLTFETVECACL